VFSNLAFTLVVSSLSKYFLSKFVTTIVLPFSTNSVLFSLFPSPSSPFVFVPECHTKPSFVIKPL